MLYPPPPSWNLIIVLIIQNKDSVLVKETGGKKKKKKKMNSWSWKLRWYHFEMNIYILEKPGLWDLHVSGLVIGLF